MSHTIDLDPEQLLDLEPFEGDDSRGHGISAFAVPDGIDIVRDQEGISTLVFRYPGGETGEGFEPLDERDDPPVRVKIARYTRKILIMEIPPPHVADAPGLRRIAERLNRRAEQEDFLAKKFSFQMIARVLDRWAEQLAA